jgi:hypothetical protein
MKHRRNAGSQIYRSRASEVSYVVGVKSYGYPGWCEFCLVVLWHDHSVFGQVLFHHTVGYTSGRSLSSHTHDHVGPNLYIWKMSIWRGQRRACPVTSESSIPYPIEVRTTRSWPHSKLSDTCRLDRNKINSSHRSSNIMTLCLVDLQYSWHWTAILCRTTITSTQDNNTEVLDSSMSISVLEYTNDADAYASELGKQVQVWVQLKNDPTGTACVFLQED